MKILLNHIQTDTANSVRRDLASEWKLEGGLAPVICKDTNLSDVESILLPSLSLAVWMTNLIMSTYMEIEKETEKESMETECNVRKEKGTSNDNTTSITTNSQILEMTTHNQERQEWIIRLVRYWSFCLRSPSLSVKTCALRMLCAIISTASTSTSTSVFPSSRFSSSSPSYSSSPSHRHSQNKKESENVNGESVVHDPLITTTSLREFLTKIVTEIPFNRLRSLGEIRLAKEKGSLPVCSEFLQVLLELLSLISPYCRVTKGQELLEIDNEVRIEKDEKVEHKESESAKERGKESAREVEREREREKTIDSNWESLSGRLFSEGGWETWSGFVYQKSVTDIPPAVQRSQERQDLPPELLPGCFVCRKRTPVNSIKTLNSSTVSTGSRKIRTDLSKGVGRADISDDVLPTISSGSPPGLIMSPRRVLDEMMREDGDEDDDGEGEREREREGDESRNRITAHLSLLDEFIRPSAAYNKSSKDTKEAKEDREIKGNKEELDDQIGRVLAISSWKNEPLGSARLIKWEGEVEEEIVRWGAEGGIFDVIHVKMKNDQIVLKHPHPYSKLVKAANKYFGLELSYGVILRIKTDELREFEEMNVKERFHGVMEWPDFCGIVSVSGVLWTDGRRTITEERLLSGPSHTGWDTRFGESRWQSGTIYNILPQPHFSSSASISTLTSTSFTSSTSPSANLSSPYKNRNTNTNSSGSPILTASGNVSNSNNCQSDLDITDVRNSEMRGKFEYKVQVAEKLVEVSGELVLQQSRLFVFDEKSAYYNITVSNDKMTVAKNGGSGQACAYGSVGFSSGIHYWEFKIEQADVGSIFLGVAEKPGAIGSSQTSRFGRWVGNGLANHRASFRSATQYSGDRLSVYGDHFHTGDTVGVLLDMNRGRISFFLDGLKYGQHTISDLGEAFDSLSVPSQLKKRTLFPIVGLSKSQDRIAITPRWLSIIGTCPEEEVRLVERAHQLLSAWNTAPSSSSSSSSSSSFSSSPSSASSPFSTKSFLTISPDTNGSVSMTSSPVLRPMNKSNNDDNFKDSNLNDNDNNNNNDKNDENVQNIKNDIISYDEKQNILYDTSSWFLKESYKDWKRWRSSRYIRVRSRCQASGLLIALDVTPRACVEASIRLGLSLAYFRGDRVSFSRSSGRKLEIKEEAVILGAYKGFLWYRLDSQQGNNDGDVMESSALAWCLVSSDIEGLVLLKRSFASTSHNNYENDLLIQQKQGERKGGELEEEQERNNININIEDADGFSQDSNSSFGEATSSNSSEGSDDDLSKQAVAEIQLPRILSFQGGLVRVTYANGAVMRDGLEIDTSEVLCSVPAETIVYALEQRLNSSNVWRLRVIYNGHYGWISERMRGGSEEYMLQKIRNPKISVLENAIQTAIEAAKILNIKDRIVWDVQPTIELAMRKWDEMVCKIGQNTVLNLGKESDESYEEYCQLITTIDGKNPWGKETDLQLADFISQCAVKEGNTPQNVSVDKMLFIIHNSNSINNDLAGLDTSDGLLPGGSLLHGICPDRIIARSSMIRVANLILRYALPYLNMTVLDEKQKKDCYGSDDSIDIDPTNIPMKIGENSTTQSSSSSSLSVPLLYAPPSTARRLRSLRRLLFTSTKTR